MHLSHHLLVRLREFPARGQGFPLPWGGWREVSNLSPNVIKGNLAHKEQILATCPNRSKMVHFKMLEGS